MHSVRGASYESTEERNRNIQIRKRFQCQYRCAYQTDRCVFIELLRSREAQTTARRACGARRMACKCPSAIESPSLSARRVTIQCARTRRKTSRAHTTSGVRICEDVEGQRGSACLRSTVCGARDATAESALAHDNTRQESARTQAQSRSFGNTLCICQYKNVA